ncbi:MAG TPA: hypothetical protein VEA69_23615 [Tepidisphaeraceae bacterium]|nr:hypothetical protein [Tepidisphaeraceae bacterium]
MHDYASQYHAVQVLRTRLRNLLPQPDAEALERRLADLAAGAQTAAGFAAATDAMAAAVRASPGADSALHDLLREGLDDPGAPVVLHAFELPPGKASPLRPGSRMVCPGDPKGCPSNTRFRMAGQPLFCPIHKRELVSQGRSARRP